MTGSEVNLSGGSVGSNFESFFGSDVELIGGDFQVNGVAFTGPTFTLGSGDVISGTLQDGSTFIFSTEASDQLSAAMLTRVALPAVDATPIVVDTALPSRPSGLRPGQTLTLRDGGELVNFEATGGTINIEGGSLESGGVTNAVVNISGGRVGDDFRAFTGSEVSISGGNVGEDFRAHSGSVVNLSGGNVGTISRALAGSEVNISGGSVGPLFRAESGSEVNLFGTEFFLNGVLLDELVLDEALIIADRGFLLTGTLADGSNFGFQDGSSLFIDANALLSVTLVESLTSPEGDYSADGVVSGADYVIWRDGGSPDSSINGYNVWRSQFGFGASGVINPGLASLVPEPSSVTLIVNCLGIILLRSRAGRD